MTKTEHLLCSSRDAEKKVSEKKSCHKTFEDYLLKGKRDFRST